MSPLSHFGRWAGAAALAALLAAAPASATDGPVAVNDRGRAAVLLLRGDEVAVSVRPRLREPFGSAQILTRSRRFESDPQVGVDNRGGSLAVFVEERRERRFTQARGLTPAARFGGARTIAPLDSFGAKVDTSRDGRRLLVYEIKGELRARFGTSQGVFGRSVSVARDPVDLSLLDAELGAGGDALVLLQGPRVVLGRTNGRFGSPVTLEDPDSQEGGDAALDDRGDALVAWSNYRGEIRVAERKAREPFTAARTIATANDPTIQGVTVGPGGEGAVVWIDRPKLRPPLLRGAVEIAGRFRPAKTLSDPQLPVSVARLSADASGNAVAAWGAASFGTFAAYRPARGTFTRRVAVARPPRGGYPELASGASGAVVSWYDFDGRRVGHLVSSIPRSPRGLRASDAVTEPLDRSPAFRTARDPARTCRQPGAKTLLENRSIRVYRVAAVTKACFRLSGQSIDVARPSQETLAFPPPAISLAGPLLAYVSVGDEYGDDDCDPTVYECNPDTYIQLVDMRLRETSPRVFLDFVVADPRRFSSKVGSVAVARDGSLAWVTCPGAPETAGDLEPGCVRPGAADTVYRLRPGGVAYDVLDEGSGIDPSSLRRRGDRFTWIADGRRRSAPVGG